jgi:hypothetical protein
MFRIPFITILICYCIISLTYAQDSIKKASSAKPVPKYKTYKYHAYAHRVAKADSPPAEATVPPTGLIKQDTAAPVPTDKSLNGQYQFLLTKVYRYQQPLIAALWKNASDTLNLNKHKLKEAIGKAAIQNKIIDSLKKDGNDKDKELSASNDRVNAISVFGFFIEKSVYNLIMWGLVAVFGIVAIIVIARSGSYSLEAKEKVRLYEELEEEFKAHKAKANEKEIKLARELQTERNKLDELLGRG